MAQNHQRKLITESEAKPRAGKLFSSSSFRTEKKKLKSFSRSTYAGLEILPVMSSIVVADRRRTRGFAVSGSQCPNSKELLPLTPFSKAAQMPVPDGKPGRCSCKRDAETAVGYGSCPQPVPKRDLPGLNGSKHVCFSGFPKSANPGCTCTGRRKILYWSEKCWRGQAGLSSLQLNSMDVVQAPILFRGQHCAFSPRLCSGFGGSSYLAKNKL